ncbi:MAG: hypothetical protein MI802_28135, partial [Desulfobacterales bacterium]|nr:hypothetical protein [Desulfobacterales bacterium]
RQFPDLFQQIALFPVTSRQYARGAIRPDKFEIAPYFEITGDQVPEQINAGSQRLVVIDVNVTDATASSDTDGFFTLTGAQAPMFCEDANGKIATIFPTGWVYKSAVHEYVTLDSNKSFVYSRPGAGSTRFSLIYRVPDGSTPFMMRFKQLAMPLEMNKEMTAAEVVAMVDKTYWDPQAAEVAVEAHEKNQGNTGLKISDGTSPGARIEGAEIVVSNALPAGYNKNSIDADLSGVSYGDMGDDRSSLRSAQGPIDHTKNRSVRGALRVDKFFHERGTVIVQLKMTENQARSTLGQAMQAAARIAKPLLHDSNGDDFEAIGYVIHGSTYTFFSLDPEQPIRAISNIERDRMNEGDELILIFKVPNDSTLTRFTIGRAVDQEIR